MKQILQNLGTGQTEIIETPCPQIKAGHILISTKASLISTGTERAAISDSKTSVVKKVLQQPEKVKKAWKLLQSEGFTATKGAIEKQFDFPITMGYSNVGVVIGVGPDIKKFKIGDRVVSNGPHAEVVNIPKNLVAKIPESVNNETAAFTVLASIGLQGIRLVEPTLGETIAVIGLGVIGLLSVQILKASGCQVIAFDLDPERVKIAESYGATGFTISEGKDPVAFAHLETAGVGVDAVLITAATNSNGPIEQSALMSRKRGRIVLTGVAGLNINRSWFYEKELEFKVSCSYGPGRYDPQYESQGHDYPLPFVRWTQQRNFQACLKLMEEKRINVDELAKNKFAINQIEKAYELIHSENSPLTVLLDYPENKNKNQQSVKLNPVPKTTNSSQAQIAVIGVGNYSKNMIIPMLNKNNAQINVLASESGLSSTLLANKLGVSESTTDIEGLFTRTDINTLVIATRHNTHASLISQALKNNKNIFVEKPLCIEPFGLKKIKKHYSESSSRLLVGYNRRFAPHSLTVTKHLRQSQAPCFIQMNINAGHIPSDHWCQDPKVGGGRLIGEACHFIDLSRHFADSPIKSIHTTAMQSKEVVDENISISLQFESGSVAVINYFANGSKSMKKEFIQVSQDGYVFQIDDFLTLNTFGPKNMRRSKKLRSQDKGQKKMFHLFLESIKEGQAMPIPIEQIFEVAEWTLKSRSQI